MSETSKTEDANSNLKVRCLVQQCTKARLCVKLADKDNNVEPEYVEVNKLFGVNIVKKALDAEKKIYVFYFIILFIRFE